MCCTDSRKAWNEGWVLSSCERLDGTTCDSNHKAIMALENKPLVNTDEPSQVHDEKDSEDLENPLKVTIKYRHRISLYSSNIPFHKWKVLADFD